MSRALYKILADDLLLKISNGEIKVGERLPPEAEYAEQLGVSRSTLRQAFSQLEHSGILKRRKRGGTEVIASKPVKHFNIVASGFYDVLSIARDTLLVITEIRDVSGSTVEEKYGMERHTDQWLLCSGDRYMAGQQNPFAVMKVYVPNHYSDIDLQVGDTAASVLGKIEERYSVVPSGVKRTISAGLCTEPVAQKIGLDVGTAVLTILTEVTDVNGELIEIADSVIDPERFKISTDVVVGV